MLNLLYSMTLGIQKRYSLIILTNATLSYFFAKNRTNDREMCSTLVNRALRTSKNIQINHI
ncbi:Uncharacterised protein [Bartonella vinsonii]|uniref:Uncharacterized protein n=1 Tax=Bartonella vinsonii TaxID=33047 RepID=A0A3S5A0T1_BARVI|nr:Uncharacterised protein [Bartonella vinsonii]